MPFSPQRRACPQYPDVRLGKSIPIPEAWKIEAGHGVAPQLCSPLLLRKPPSKPWGEPIAESRNEPIAECMKIVDI